MLKEFWEEEEGMGTVEILLIIGVLIVIALIFKNAIIGFVQKLIGKIFDPKVADDIMSTPAPTGP